MQNISSSGNQPSTLAFDPKAMAAHKNSNSPEALQAAAVQFESLMLEEMLKSMRSATNVLADNSLINRDQEMQYQGMYDSQLAFNMASSGTLGLAEHLVQQVTEQQGSK